MGLVYEGMQDHDIDAIRLQVHMVGTRQWDAYSKAKYLNHLRNEKNMPMHLIVEYCGGREKEVLESINAYSDMENHYRPLVDDGNFDITRFSGFVELQKPNIKQVLVEHGFTVSDFASWIATNKLFPLNTVRLLPRILKNKKAREEFLKFGAVRAAGFLDQPSLSKALTDASLAQLASALTQMIYQMPWPEKEKLCNDPNGETTQALSEATFALKQLLNLPDTGA